jgi:hypothetical protein
MILAVRAAWFALSVASSFEREWNWQRFKPGNATLKQI